MPESNCSSPEATIWFVLSLFLFFADGKFPSLFPFPLAAKEIVTMTKAVRVNLRIQTVMYHTE